MSEELSAQLAKAELFSAMKKEELAALAAIAAPMNFKKGQEIFAEGDRGEALYQIIQGRVSISKKDTGGVMREIVVLKENDILGEMGLLTDMPRSASATSVTDAQLLCIFRRDFNRRLEAGDAQSYRIMCHLIGILCRRLRDMNERVSQLLQKDASKARPELAALRERLTKEWSF